MTPRVYLSVVEPPQRGRRRESRPPSDTLAVQDAVDTAAVAPPPVHANPPSPSGAYISLLAVFSPAAVLGRRHVHTAAICCLLYRRYQFGLFSSSVLFVQQPRPVLDPPNTRQNLAFNIGQTMPLNALRYSPRRRRLAPPDACAAGDARSWEARPTSLRLPARTACTPPQRRRAARCPLLEAVAAWSAPRALSSSAHTSPQAVPSSWNALLPSLRVVCEWRPRTRPSYKVS